MSARAWIRELGGPFYAAVAGWVALLAIALMGNACSPRKVELDLQRSVERAMDAGGHSFVAVRMDGQVAELEGYASAESAVKAVELAALTAAGPGGPWAGGVTAVRNRVQALNPKQPFVWRLSREGATVRIEGSVTSSLARRRLQARARETFAGAAIEDLAEPAAGAPPGPSWAGIAARAMGIAQHLESGVATLTDTTLVVTGEAKPEALKRLRAAAAELPEPYTAVLDVAAPGTGLGIPELEGLALSQQAGAEDCQIAFERILATNVITFEANSARLDGAGFPLLDNLARVARRCDRYSIEIAGHTSSEGERDLNMALSKDRAQAVVDYLVQRGVSAQRVVAQGYGPDRPKAANSTAAGRAANRRIEFAVAR